MMGPIYVALAVIVLLLAGAGYWAWRQTHPGLLSSLEKRARDAMKRAEELGKKK
jgi:hypothetical protein